MFDVYRATPRFSPLVIAAFYRDDLKGILLAVVQKEHEGLLGTLSARSIIWGGPLTDSGEVTSELLRHYNETVRGKAVYTQVRNFHPLRPEQRKPYEANGFTYEEHLNILVDLTVGMEEFWRGIKSNRRRGINKAKGRGFGFDVATDARYLEIFYRLLGKTYRQIRLPIPDEAFFAALQDNLAGSLRWFALTKDGEPVIVMVALLDGKLLRPFYIGGPEDPRLLQERPTDLFHFEVMRWAIANGFAVYDWMGAGKPGKDYGVRDFKMQYGGELVETGRFMKIHKPLVMAMSKLGFWFWRRIQG
ncbi:MAG: GNAT family N-acetyltransferase [Candidatus Aminicenantes bacterium]|nr:GNAT family N-acetyltransferase [Candidatus Aminicenantes bacterium]